MIFKQINSGGDRNFAYLVESEETGEVTLVDPSPDARKVMEEVGDGMNIKYVINTHSHFDHSGGNGFFTACSDYEKVIFINTAGNRGLKDGQTLELGELSLKVILTPGHTPDSICIKVKDKLVTGDTLFVGKVGGTYSEKDSREEFVSLKKLMKLPPQTEVWPGHDYGVKPHSTIAYELENNPFIKRLDDFDDFFWLKKNWARYKEEHGIK